MNQLLEDVLIVAIMAAVVVLYLRNSLASLVRQAPLLATRLQATAALCESRGMLPNAANLASYLPMANPAGPPTFGPAFATPDGRLWAGDLWRREGSGKAMVTEAFSMLAFTVSGVKVPYVAVARKGQMSIPAGVDGSPVGLESIDFNDQFAVSAVDGRSAVMLLDLGMMQLLLDCDQVSFEMLGDRVQALVRRKDQPTSSAPPSAEPVEYELLFRFLDGFMQRLPAILRTEYAATLT
jgi:hypothetical protein